MRLYPVNWVLEAPAYKLCPMSIGKVPPSIGAHRQHLVDAGRDLGGAIGGGVDPRNPRCVEVRHGRKGCGASAVHAPHYKHYQSACLASRWYVVVVVRVV